MRKLDLGVPNAITNQLPSAVTDRLPTHLTTKKSRFARLRKPAGIVILGAVIAGITMKASRSRYLTGAAELKSITDVPESNGIIVQLHGIVFWADAELRKSIEAAAERGLVPYLIDRLQPRKNGLLVGTLIDSDGFYHEAAFAPDGI